MDTKEIDECIESVEAKSLEATHSILRTAVKTEEIAVKVCTTVKGQGERLRGIHHKTSGIAEDLTLAEKDISKLERPWWWCCCWRPFWARRQRKRRLREAATGVRYISTSGQPTATGSAAVVGPAMVEVVTGSERERNIDENLRQTAVIVGNLKHRAEELGEELNEHNRILDDMNKGTEEVLQQLQEDNERLHKL